MVKYLPDLLPIADPTAYKLHFARYNKEAASRGFSDSDVEPVKVLLRSCEKLRAGESWTPWHDWQVYRPHNNMFNRDYVFTLACYERPDRWLFGGIFQIVARCPEKYVVELTDEGKELIGNLILRSTYNGRNVRVNFEKHYENLEIESFSRATGRGDG